MSFNLIYDFFKESYDINILLDFWLSEIVTREIIFANTLQSVYCEFLGYARVFGGVYPVHMSCTRWLLHYACPRIIISRDTDR